MAHAGAPSIRHLLKILSALAVAVVVIGVVASAAFVLFFDPNDYKPQIDAALSARIGRPVHIDGPIELSVFPWLAIDFDRATVANAKGFGDQPLARVESASAGVRAWPLIGGHLKIGTVALNGLKLNLTRRADGMSNWQSILDQLASTASDSGAPNAEHAPAAKTGGDASKSFIESLAIQAVALQNAELVFTDAGRVYRLTHADLQTDRIESGEPFSLNLAGRLAAPARDAVAKLTLASRITPHFKAMRYVVDKFNAKAKASGAPFSGTQTITLSGQAKADLDAHTVSASDLTLQAASVRAIANVSAREQNGRLRYDGTLRVKPFDPRSALTRLGAPVGDDLAEDALKSARLNADFSGTGQRVDVDKFTARLDETEVNGSASARFAPVAYTFDVEANKIDVGRYTRSVGGARAESDKDSGGDGAPAPSVDLAFLKGLRLDGHADVGALTVNDTQVENAAVDIAAKNGVLRIKPLTARLYGGRLDLTARLDARGKTPRYASRAALAGVRFRPLLADFANIRVLSGRGDLRFDLRSAGNRLRALERGLDGKARLTIGRGALHGIDLRRILAAIAQGQSFKQALASSKTTVFKNLEARFRVSRGVVRGNDLSLATRAVQVRGAGSYDLPDNDLDYRVKLIVPDSATGAVARFAGATVPVQLRGPIGAPRVGVDVEQVLREQARHRLQKATRSLTDKLRDDLHGGDSNEPKRAPDAGDAVEQGLKRLFGQ